MNSPDGDQIVALKDQKRLQRQRQCRIGRAILDLECEQARDP